MPDHHDPLIVITVSEPKRSADPELAQRKNELYATAIARHGGEPALLTTATPRAERDALLARMDGLLLAGGADIEPRRYREKAAGAKDPDPERDELESLAWQAAEDRELPVLGICRGLQVVNVFSGGTLLQDVPSHAGTPYGQGPAHLHKLEIDPNSRLGRAIAAAAPDGVAAADPTDNTLELEVNSFHHQAVNESGLAPGLRAAAWASSEAGRLVEGLESTTGRWIMAVQCHPERTDSTPGQLDGIFDDFVLAAAMSHVRAAEEAGSVRAAAIGRGEAAATS